MSNAPPSQYLHLKDGEGSTEDIFCRMVAQNWPGGFNLLSTSSVPKGLQELLSGFAIALSFVPLPQTDVHAETLQHLQAFVYVYSKL